MASVPDPFPVAISPVSLLSVARRRCSPIRCGRRSRPRLRRCRPAEPAGRRGVLEIGARAVRDAAGPRRAERRQPLPRLAAGARSAEARERQRRSRSVAAEPRAADRREGEHAQDARRVPARHAGRDRHHPQHQRGEQHGLERPRPQGRRRSASSFTDNHPSNLTAWNEKAKRFGFTVDRDPADESASRAWSTTSTPTRRRSRRGPRS